MYSTAELSLLIHFDLEETATRFSQITEVAVAVLLSNGLGMASGLVAAGYEAFEIVTTGPTELTIEVVVTTVFEGRESTNNDSSLMLFDAEGRLIATDDDGGDDSGSKLEDVRIPDAGSYYAVVTTYPNETELDEDDHFVAFYPEGDSHIGLQLVVRERYLRCRAAS